MRRNLLRGTTALVIVGGLALVGCSSNDGADVIAPKQTTPPLSKTDYVEQANAICSKAEDQIVELQSDDPSDGGSRSTDERDTLVGEITPIAQDAIDELEALTPPAADAEMITKGLDRMQATLDTAQTNATA